MQGVAATVFHGGGKRVEHVRVYSLDVVKDCTALQVQMHSFDQVVAHGLEERVSARCFPLSVGSCLRVYSLIKATFAYSLPNRPYGLSDRVATLSEEPRYLADPIGVTVGC